MIDALATEPHFLDHIAPVWAALPDAGTLWIARTLHDRAVNLGCAGVRIGRPTATTSTPVLVASFGDMKKARRARRPVIVMEHGAGQSYAGLEGVTGSYVGAKDRAGAVLALVPNAQAKARHDAAHPEIPCVVIGSPHLDTLPREPGSVPAISFHWDSHLCPETRSAWAEYGHHLGPLVEQYPGTIGHAHPRLWPRAHSWMTRCGLDTVRDFPEVCARASVYAVDNSSTLFTFAALDKPVVVINSKHYRRDVHHGGRFWDWADVGVQCDDPADLADCIALALSDPADVAARRREVAAEVYPHQGDAAERAVAAIADVVARRALEVS